VSKCKAVLALASFHNSSAQFLSLRGVLTERCPMVVVNLPIYFSLFERVLQVSNFRVFSPLLIFWPLSILKLQLIFRKCSKYGHLTSLSKEEAFLIANIMSNKGGPFFIFSLPGGRLTPLAPRQLRHC